jgi:membrane protein implicated in regulation of membrane protease activity
VAIAKMKNVIIALVIGFVVFEVIEHVLFPLFWSIKQRKVRSVSGATGMIGKVGQVKHWKEGGGRVFVNGELWSAVSDDAFLPGDKAVIEQVEGLTLKVKAYTA